MVYQIKILIERKEGILNPEAMVIQNATRQLGYEVENFGCGKYFYYESKEPTEESAKKEARDLSDRLLANPVIEKFKIISIKKIE